MEDSASRSVEQNRKLFLNVFYLLTETYSLSVAWEEIKGGDSIQEVFKALKSISIENWSSFLENYELVTDIFSTEMHYIFTFDMFHKIHLRNSTHLK